MELKYIVTDDDEFCIFSTSQCHAVVAQALRGKPVGAGTCIIAPEANSPRASVRCYGRSDALDVSSREADGQIINRQINDWM